MTIDEKLARYRKMNGSVQKGQLKAEYTLEGNKKRRNRQMPITTLREFLSTYFTSRSVYFYTVPVITSVPTPGLEIQTPVVASCVKVPAGTVMLPAVVAKRPVVSL